MSVHVTGKHDSAHDAEQDSNPDETGTDRQRGGEQQDSPEDLHRSTIGSDCPHGKAGRIHCAECLGESGAVSAIASQLEPDALRVWLRIGQRLIQGRRDYGDLNLETDRRDFGAEAQEEALDMAVYLACGLERGDG